MAERSDKIKGVIPFPCCAKEKVIAYINSHGLSSIKCPKCGSFALFDYDAMTAKPIKATRGVVGKLKFNNINTD